MTRKLVICRPAHDVALFGGPASVEIHVGTMVRVHPACDLFMQGAKYAEIRSVGDNTCKVRPYIGGTPVKGKLRTIRHDHILVDEKGIGV